MSFFLWRTKLVLLFAKLLRNKTIPFFNLSTQHFKQKVDMAFFTKEIITLSRTVCFFSLFVLLQAFDKGQEFYNCVQLV